MNYPFKPRIPSVFIVVADASGPTRPGCNTYGGGGGAEDVCATSCNSGHNFYSSSSIKFSMVKKNKKQKNIVAIQREQSIEEIYLFTSATPGLNKHTPQMCHPNIVF